MTPPPIECFFIVSTASILVSVLFIKEINAMEKRLRSMSATVHTRKYDNNVVYILKSYETIVAAYYPVANELYFGPKYDCSQTTMKHVRAFFSDYVGVDVSIPDLRKQMTNMCFDGEFRTIKLDGVEFNAYTCSQSQLTDMMWRSKA